MIYIYIYIYVYICTYISIRGIMPYDVCRAFSIVDWHAQILYLSSCFRQSHGGTPKSSKTYWNRWWRGDPLWVQNPPQYIRRFPKIGVSPSSHPFWIGIFHEINHLFWATPLKISHHFPVKYHKYPIKNPYWWWFNPTYFGVPPWLWKPPKLSRGTTGTTGSAGTARRRARRAPLWLVVLGKMGFS